MNIFDVQKQIKRSLTQWRYSRKSSIPALIKNMAIAAYSAASEELQDWLNEEQWYRKWKGGSWVYGGYHDDDHEYWIQSNREHAHQSGFVIHKYENWNQ